MTTIETVRTRADRVQQLASFLAKHPEIGSDFSDSDLGGRPQLNFHPRDAASVETLKAALHELGDHWDTTYLMQGWVTLDSGAIGYASVAIHLPLIEQPRSIFDPSAAALFA